MKVLSVDLGFVNLSYCIADFDLEEHTFDLLHCVKTQIGVKRDTCAKLSKSLIDHFNESEIISDEEFDYVLIEQQVSRSPKNMVMGFSCYSYFYTRTLMKGHETICTFVRPRDKFLAVEAYFPGTLENYDIDSTTACSRDLKKLSIRIGTDLFRDLNIELGLRLLEENKKKLDDICDCVNQMFAIFMDKYSKENLGTGNPLRVKRKR